MMAPKGKRRKVHLQKKRQLKPLGAWSLHQLIINRIPPKTQAPRAYRSEAPASNLCS